MANEFMMVYITTSSEEEALEIASKVVDEKLAACANILPKMKSVYSWKGESFVDDEVVLIFKTVTSQFEQLKNRVIELHSYELPCVVAIPITHGHEPYLHWLTEQTTK